MKLNSPWKALLWEEFYVGGSIISLVLGVCVLCTFSCLIFIPERLIHWEEIDIVCYLVSYAISLLLLLQIGNSGEMQVGIPRRIFYLPVPSYLVVTISLFTRIFLIIIFTFLSRILIASLLVFFLPNLNSSLHDYNQYINIFRKSFPFEVDFFLPLIVPSVIHVFVYITVQFFCWFFILAPLFMGIIIFLSIFTFITLLMVNDLIIDIIFSLFLPFSNSVYHDRMDVLRNNYLLFLIFLILYVFIIWLLSIKVTSTVRVGVRKDLKSLGPSQLLDYLDRLKPGMFIKKFSNTHTAQVWFEIKNNGLIIPKWTFIFWSLISIFYIFIWLVSIYIHYGLKFSYIYYIFYPNMVFIYPLFAMILAGVVWYLKVTRRMMRDFKSGVFPLSHIPITRKERIYSYWLVGNINLLITLPIIWLIVFTFLYLKFKMHVFPDSSFGGINTDVVQLPFSDITPFLLSLLIFTFGLILFCGLFIWLMMFYPSSILIFAFLLLYLLIPWNYYSLPHKLREIYLTIYNFFYIGYIISDIVHFIQRGIFSFCPSLRDRHLSFPNFVFHAVYFYVVFMFFVYLYIGIRNRLIGKKELLFLFIFHIFTFVCIMPWHLWGSVSPSMLIMTYLFLSAIFSGAWLKLLLSAHGYRWRRGVPLFTENSVKYTAKDENIFYLFVGYIVILCFAILMIISRINMGVSEKCVAYFHKNSLPETIDEISEKYHSVPDSENLAKKYYNLFPLDSEIMGYENRLLADKIKKLGGDKYINQILNDNYSILIKNDLPLPELAYYEYKEFYEKVYKKLTDELHKAAESGLEKGHYPINLKKGFSMELPHLAILRNFVRKLFLEAVLSAIDEDYEKMLRAYRTTASIYKSLEDEPVYISQMVRIALFGIMYGNMEWIFNHKELPECVLSELSDIIQRCAIPMEKRSIFSDALHYETLVFMSILPVYYHEEFLIEINRRVDPSEYRRNRDILKSWVSIIDPFYSTEIEQMVGVNVYTLLRRTATEVARQEQIDIPAKQFLDFHTDCLLERKRVNSLFVTTPPYWFYFTLSIVYPGLTKCIDAELRHLTFINLAQTAIAIERFRLKNNRIPDELQELVPDYLPAVPRDPWNNGKPIKYIKGEDCSYNIYSIGMDKEDDGGIDVDKTRGIDTIIEGDFKFSVLPLSIRREPDVS